MNRKVALALSGGGIRATVFHLGILKRLAEENQLENIGSISSVSGGSLCVGLIYSHNNLAWPTSEQYLTSVLPGIKQVLLNSNIQTSAIRRLICSPWNLGRKVNTLAQVLSKKWGVCGNMHDLATYPAWYVNCTTYETGKRFKITQTLMGDYKVGYVANPCIPIADAIAASAGFPILIGPYKLDYTQYKWTASSYEKKAELKVPDKYLHLWDGGVYDNLGLESVFKMTNGGQLEGDIEYLIISNASGDMEYQTRKPGLTGRSLMHLLSVAMDQVASLRMRSAMSMISQKNNGTIFKIGNDTEYILRKSKLSDKAKKELIQESLSSHEVTKISRYPTTLFRPSESDFDLLLRHGYEVAKYTNMLVDELSANTITI